MATITPDEVSRIIRTKAATVWDSMRFDAETCRTWAEALDGMTAAQVAAAMSHHVKHNPHSPKPADIRAAFRALTAGTDRTEESRPGGPRSKPSCPDCHRGWVECPPIVVRSQPRGDVPATEIRYPEVVKPCPRCLPETHQKWQTGQFGSEANR